MTLIEKIQEKIGLDIQHIGVYLVSKTKEYGFIDKQSNDLKSSIERIETDEEIVSVEIVLGVEYLPDPLAWNKTEGVLFRWGDKCSSVILPSQLQNYAKLQKEEIFDRLCSQKAGVPSNFWRLAEGLIFSVKTLTVSISE